MNTMNAVGIQEGMKTMPIEDIKKKKVICIIWEGSQEDKDLLSDILRKSQTLNINWNMIWRKASDGILLTLLKDDAFEALKRGGFEF